MFQLVFEPKALPRTMTRDEWRRVWRWKRATERRIKDGLEARWQTHKMMLSAGGLFRDDAHADKLRTVIERDLNSLVNPPLLVYPPPQNIVIDAKMMPGAVVFPETPPLIIGLDVAGSPDVTARVQYDPATGRIV